MHIPVSFYAHDKFTTSFMQQSEMSKTQSLETTRADSKTCCRPLFYTERIIYLIYNLFLCRQTKWDKCLSI